MAVIKEGKVVHQQYYGKAKLDQDIPVAASTLFKQHSLSKIFVATGIFQLIEQGKLSLEEDIRKYLPELQSLNSKITVQQLAIELLPKENQNLYKKTANRKRYQARPRLEIDLEYILAKYFEHKLNEIKELSQRRV